MGHPHAKPWVPGWAPAVALTALVFAAACGSDDGETGPSPTCTPNAVACDGNAIITCSADGQSWSAPQACEQGEQCESGTCSPGAVEILTAALPNATVGMAYAATLQANRDGCSWAVSQGALPDGIALAAAGALSGTALAAGDFNLTIAADCGAEGTAERAYVLTVLPPGFVITTTSLPAAQEGFDYSFQLAATGGTEPYAWMVADGLLPAGITLTAAGELLGAPSEIGEFPMVLKAFDNSPSPQVASQALTLSVGIAPLEIYGEQEFNLILGKLVILDTIIIVPGFPLPYATQLLARGGLKPYAWTEAEIPGALSYLFPTSGIPDGLTLQTDGALEGSVTSTDQVITITVPLSTTQITGFFFAAQVADAQDPAETQTAVFVLPTVPVE